MSSRRLAERDRTAYRPVRAIGLLLVLQVVGLATLGTFEVSQVDWRRVRLTVWPSSRQVIEAVAFVLFVPPAVLALLSALSFLLLRRRGWLLAAISQGATLVVCLYLYSELEPVYVYPVMAFCVLIILYLNSHGVRMVFRRGREAAKLGDGA